MNAENQLILDIIQKLFLKKISFETALLVLNVSERTVYRYLKRYEALGERFLIHGNSNKTPVNKTSIVEVEKAKALMKEKYFDFNMTHALEKFKKDEGFELNRETFRHICHEIEQRYHSEFFESETNIGCLMVLRKIVEKKGLFSVLYVDRAGIFGGPKRVHFAQVKRALKE